MSIFGLGAFRHSSLGMFRACLGNVSTGGAATVGGSGMTSGVGRGVGVRL
jgi:hypothetical protein